MRCRNGAGFVAAGEVLVARAGAVDPLDERVGVQIADTAERLVESAASPPWRRQRAAAVELTGSSTFDHLDSRAAALPSRSFESRP
jgi:hypothetical protein